jgi:hypothetical protein
MKRSVKGLIGSIFRVTGRHPKVLLDKAKWVEILESLQARETGIPLIRVGQAGDGGYLLPDDLDGVTTLISPGAGGNASFELALERYGIHSIIIDDSELEKPKVMPIKSTFINKSVSGHNSENSISLNSLVDLADLTGDLILQMDIEGHEYSALNSLDQTQLDRFRIIVIEFHYTFDWIFQHNWKWTYEHMFTKLLKNHMVVHLHPNNSGGDFEFAGIRFPNLLEVTLLRKDRVQELGEIIQVESELDVDCDPDLKSMKRKGLGIA